MSKLGAFTAGAVRGAISGVIKGAIYGAVAAAGIYALGAFGLVAAGTTGFGSLVATAGSWIGVTNLGAVGAAAVGGGAPVFGLSTILPLAGLGAAVVGGFKALTTGVREYSITSRQEAAMATAQRSVAQAQKAMSVALAPERPQPSQGPQRSAFLQEILADRPSRSASFTQQVEAERAAAANAQRSV